MRLRSCLRNLTPHEQFENLDKGSRTIQSKSNLLNSGTKHTVAETRDLVKKWINIWQIFF